MNEYAYIVTVKAASADQAHQVMAERLGHDEDYGFEYGVDYSTYRPECIDASHPVVENGYCVDCGQRVSE